jgi:hypothetical protein
MDCKCDIGGKRRAMYLALERMAQYVRNLDTYSLQRVLKGQPVFTQERVEDWSLLEQRYPSPWHIPVIRLELRTEYLG